jgi:tRNA(Ile)-lysidine synthase
VHPLIAARRPETRAYCDETSLRYLDDPGNEDPRFERSVVRAHVLRAIEEEWGDGAVRAMAESAERLREDSSFLARLAETLYGQMAHRVEEGISFDLDRFTEAPRALRRRLLESAVGRVRDRSGGINAALDALERDRKPNARFAVASGVEIEIEATRVLVRKPQPAPG